MNANAERAFLALWPDEDARRRLIALQHALAPAMDAFHPRWTHPEDLHLTLRFLGELVPSACERLRTWLDEVTSVPQPLTPLQLAWWPDAQRQRLIVLRLRNVSWLDALAGAAGDAASGTGLPPDTQPFTPHVTLARLTPAHAALPASPAPPAALGFARLGLYARCQDTHAKRRYQAIDTRDLSHP